MIRKKTALSGEDEAAPLTYTERMAQLNYIIASGMFANSALFSHRSHNDRPIHKEDTKLTRMFVLCLILEK